MTEGGGGGQRTPCRYPQGHEAHWGCGTVPIGGYGHSSFWGVGGVQPPHQPPLPPGGAVLEAPKNIFGLNGLAPEESFDWPKTRKQIRGHL